MSWQAHLYRAFVSACVVFFTGIISAQASDISIRQITGAEGVPLNVAEAGTPGAPGLLFIHGNGQSYLSWHRQLESSLAEDFHLVAFDLRGHGNSGKPWDEGSYNRACVWADDVAAVIAATGLVKPIILGWSRGGLIAMHYIQCKGTSGLSGIVMVSSRGRLVDVPLPPGDSAARMSQVQLEDQDLRVNMRGAEAFATLMTAKPMSEDWAEVSKVMNIMTPPYARRAMRSPTLGPDGNALPNYAHLTSQINLPFLAVLGDRDPFRDSSQLAEAFKAQIPRAQIIMYSGVGHSPFLEDPHRFNADIRAFADGIQMTGKTPPQ